jgi:hypothetical protein
MYKLFATDKPEGIRDNIKLAHELKHNFAFVYAVCFFLFRKILLPQSQQQ